MRYADLRFDLTLRTIRYLDDCGLESEFIPTEPSIVYGRDTTLYGGKLCENVVQATARDLLGSYALMAAGEYGIGELRVRIELAQGAEGPPLRLIIEPASAAGERAAPLFPRIGGNPALVRLIVPPAWSAKLEFGADGTLGGSDTLVTLQ